MGEISRRVFLKSSTAVAVAAGTLSAIPAVPAVVSAVETQGPADAGAAESAATDVETSGALSEGFIAHVRDLSSGEIGIFSGTREITVLDPQLAARLARAIG